MALPGAEKLVSHVRLAAPMLPASNHRLQLISLSGAKWTIVTSGESMLVTGGDRDLIATMTVTKASNKYAPRALEKAGIPIPEVGLITANDVIEGKPHPAPYLAGAERCGAKPSNCASRSFSLMVFPLRTPFRPRCGRRHLWIEIRPGSRSSNSGRLHFNATIGSQK